MGSTRAEIGHVEVALVVAHCGLGLLERVRESKRKRKEEQKLKP